MEALCDMRIHGRILGSKRPVKRAKVLLALLAATTHNHSFRDLADKYSFGEGETNMCEIMDKWVNSVRSEGQQQVLNAMANASNNDQLKAALASDQQPTVDDFIHQWKTIIHTEAEKTGYENGERVGAQSTQRLVAQNLLRMSNLSVQEIADATGISPEEIKTLKEN